MTSPGGAGAKGRVHDEGLPPGDGLDPVGRVERELRGARAGIGGWTEENGLPLSFLPVAPGHGRADRGAGKPLYRRLLLGQAKAEGSRGNSSGLLASGSRVDIQGDRLLPLLASSC